MCYYLTISVGKDRTAAAQAFFSENFRLRENKNPFFEQNFGKGFVAYDVTDGHCSCSIVADLTAAEETTDETARMIEKYRRKGWSENKIRRALENHNAKPERDTDSGIRESLARFFQELGGFHLFAHMYRGMIDGEPLKAANHKELTISELTEKNADVPPDVLIKIK